MTIDTRGAETFSARRSVASALAPGARVATLWAALGELAFVGVVYAAYRLGRLVTADAVGAARAHAQDVHELQRSLGLPSEEAIQDLFGATHVFEAANLYYIALHFPVVVAFLAWGFLARPRAEYRWARNLLVVQTLAAVTIHIAYPLAPPRMFAEWGFVDTMTVYGPSAYDGPSAAVANQYAAMPSLHAGWAILIALVISRTGPPLLGHLARTHAVLTLLVITVTANHWFVDTFVSVALLGVALLLFPAPGRARLSADALRRLARRQARDDAPDPELARIRRAGAGTSSESGTTNREECLMGNDDKLQNTAEEKLGEAKEAFGKATDDEDLQAEGKGDQMKGSLKQAGEKVKDAFK